MPKLRALSATDVVRILSLFGFTVASQRGSHLKLQRILSSGKQTLTIPNHANLDKGTAKAIYRQMLRYLTEGELHPHFYTD